MSLLNIFCTSIIHLNAHNVIFYTADQTRHSICCVSDLQGNQRTRPLSMGSLVTGSFNLLSWAALGGGGLLQEHICSKASCAWGPEIRITATPHFPCPEDKANIVSPPGILSPLDVDEMNFLGQQNTEKYMYIAKACVKGES